VSGVWLAASSAAILLLLVTLVGSAAAVSGPTKLLSAGVSPRSGFPTTTITFTVTYRNRYGDAPLYVRVLVDGVARGMRVVGSQLDYHGGVRYRLATTLALGRHRIAFTASDARKFSDTIQAGRVTIAAASDAGSGGTGSSAGSTSDSTPGSSPSGGSPEGGSSAGTVTDVNRRDSSVARYEPPLPGDDAGVPSTAATTPDASGPAVGPGSGAAGPTDASGADGASGSTGATAGSPATAGLAVLGPAGGLSAEQRMVVTAISTTTTTVAAMAFLFFGKRRRDGEPPAPDEVLAADAALMTVVPTASVAQPYGGPTTGGDTDESGMPRWRRPSLMAARKSDPLREEAAVAAKLTFDDGVVDPLEGRERRRIKYRVVRLLDAPDELRSHEIGLLDEGDEVQLIERSGSFWRVLCPDGSQGWVHRMTLGDVVDVSAGGRPDRSFADATDDIDSDVLAAYLRVKGIP